MHHKIAIVIASHNQGKLAEIRNLLKDFPIAIKSLDDFGPIPEIEEDGISFDENAYKKASLTARYLGLPALADDSGLSVQALNGAPGVYSARYAGENATDKDRYTKLLNEIKDESNRNAAFKCVISVAMPTGEALTFEAKCEGSLVKTPIGSNGFGYDPIFYYPDLKKTFAELTMSEKSSISHRGKALKELVKDFDKVLIWIKQHMPIQEKFKCVE